MTGEDSESSEESFCRLFGADRAISDSWTDWLEELTIEQAQWIARATVGAPVYLNSLKTLSPEVATALGDKHSALALNGLETLEVETAEALLPCTERHLFLNGLKDISVAIVEALDDRHDWLGLNGLKTLSDDVAKALSRHFGGILTLKGLHEISDNAAESLFFSNFASLSLVGLQRDGVTFEAWETLTRYERDIEFPDDFFFWEYDDPEGEADDPPE